MDGFRDPSFPHHFADSDMETQASGSLEDDSRNKKHLLCITQSIPDGSLYVQPVNSDLILKTEEEAKTQG
jgi:hypothetical protein